MIKKTRPIITNAGFILVAIIAFVLRFVNLSYSDYQGDEIKAMFVVPNNQTVFEFLINQRKGPGQFVVTSIVKLIDQDYSSEFLTRLPFAVAGFLSVLFFYNLVEKCFNKKIAFYASIFFATNGFLVALSRIAQYQSFVILFAILSAYCAFLAYKKDEFSKNGIFLTFFFWALSILFHYDGIFNFPIILYFVFLWYKKYVKSLSKTDEYFRRLLLSLVFSGLLLSIFYIPFILNISQNTISYWGGRISGEVSTKLSSSKYLFTVYQPIYTIHFYTALFISGLLFFSLEMFKRIFTKIKLVNKIPSFIFDNQTTVIFFIWFLVPLVFLEGLIYIPGTHIYNYLIPSFVILALGIVFIEKIIEHFRKYFIPSVISYAGLSALFIFLFLQSYTIFVENKTEYPWEREKFLIWELHKPTPIYHLSMFGFPYYRNWEGIRDVIMGSEHNGYYSTNERKSIARFYVPLKKGTDNAGYFIHIKNPQSFTNKIQQDKALYWSERYPPVFTFSRGGKDLVRIFKMEPGTVEEIMEKGY